jgi:hypothetical protein
MEDKNMKRTIVLALVMAACLGMVIACGDADSDVTKYTVTFDKNTDVVGDSISQTSRKVEKGKPIGTLPTGTSSTHNLIKWTEESDDASTTVTAGTLVNGNMTVYAQWKLKPTSAPVKVGATTQDLTVTASEGATVTYIDDGYRVDKTSSAYGANASFKVNLGVGKTLNNFEKVTFTYKPVSGDTGYKDIWLLASGEEIPVSVDTDNAYKTTLAVSAFRWQKTGSSSENITAILGTLQKESGGPDYKPVPEIGNEVYFSIYLHSTASTYEITNIGFVPVPEGHIPVTSIVGVPATGTVDEETDLSVGVTVLPQMATNKTIVWSVKTAGAGVSTGPLADGKFTPTSKGTVTVTATIADGATASTPYTQDFSITINPVAKEKSIALTGTIAGGYTGTLDVDGLGFSVTGGVNYDWAYAVFTVNLGTFSLADVSKVAFTYTPVGGDTGWKDFKLFAGTTLSTTGQVPAGSLVGTVHFEDPTGGIPLEVMIDPAKASGITGSTIQIGFNLHAETKKDNVDTAFNISNIKFWIFE